MSHPPRLPGLLLLIALLAGCAQDATAPFIPGSALLSKKPGTVNSVPLRVTISEICDPAADPAEAGWCRIRSDGLGSYTDGAQNVKAVLDQYGNFIFDTNTSRNPALRHVVHDFRSRYGAMGTPAGAPEPDLTRNFHFATIKSQLSTGAEKFQSMEEGSIQCVVLGSSYTLKSSPKLTARVSFHRGYEDTMESPTAYVVVQRVDIDTWTMRPGTGATCANIPPESKAKNDDVGAVRSDDGTSLHGYYHLPFIFTLTRK